MLIDLYFETGLLSLIVSAIVLYIPVHWYMETYPERAALTAVLGVIGWLYGWVVDPEVMFVDGPLLLLCGQALAALICTREGWRLILIFTFIWIALGILERLLSD